MHELRKAVKLKPLQGALLHTAMTDPARFAREHPDTKAFVEARQAPIALVINIESQAAIDNMEAMLAVPGVDAVLVQSVLVRVFYPLGITVLHICPQVFLGTSLCTLHPVLSMLSSHSVYSLSSSLSQSSASYPSYIDGLLTSLLVSHSTYVSIT